MPLINEFDNYRSMKTLDQVYEMKHNPNLDMYKKPLDFLLNKKISEYQGYDDSLYQSVIAG